MSASDSPGLFVGDDADDSDDSISITSTEPEAPQAVYTIDKILAEGEREEDGEPVWLGP